MESTKVFTRREFNFSELGCFFAFSDKQFNEQKKAGVKYVSLPGGLLCPKEEASTIWDKFYKFNSVERKREREWKGKEKIIKEQLSNYECWYLGDYTEALPPLSDYGITEEEVREVFNKYREAEMSQL